MQARIALALIVTACAFSPAAAAQVQPDFTFQETGAGGVERGLRWRAGETLLQGFFGVSEYTNIGIDGATDGDSGELDQVPLIGGGGQWKLGGERIDLGLESMLSFGGRANAEAFAIGGSGAAVAVDVDMLIFELYGGPFASMFVGDKLRLYGAAGPLFQWADYVQDNGITETDGSGFGSGWYARAGFEFALPSRSFLGMGIRWSDSSVDLGAGMGDLEIEGLQIFVTLSRGI